MLSLIILNVFIVITYDADSRVLKAFEVVNDVLADVVDFFKDNVAAGKYIRFYFTSDPVLLKILSQGSDPESIQEDFEKLFNSISSGAVVTWGGAEHGGDSSAVASKLVRDVQLIDDRSCEPEEEEEELVKKDHFAEASAYEFQSSGVIEMLEKLLDRLIAERTTFEKDEMNFKHAYVMLVQELEAHIEICGNIHGKFLCASGGKTYAVSETQKFGHVTFFWIGNKSGYINEEMATYQCIGSDKSVFDKEPLMKAREATDTVLKVLAKGGYDMIHVNHANPDMVRHTGLRGDVDWQDHHDRRRGR